MLFLSDFKKKKNFIFSTAFRKTGISNFMRSHMRITAGYTWTDYKTNTQITKELKITPVLDKLLEYRRNWIQHVNRMPRNRLPRVMKHYCPTGRRNYGRPLKRLLDTWERNRSTSGQSSWQIYDDVVMMMMKNPSSGSLGVSRYENIRGQELEESRPQQRRKGKAS